MKKAQWIEFFREITRSLNRFLSILFIVALGVAFYTGVRSAEPDMRISADALFDETKLMDVRIVSTLGLTDDDVEEVRLVKGVKNAEGAYSIDVLANVGDNEYVLQVLSACESVNQMTIKEGRMPIDSTECFVDELFIQETGYGIGDAIPLSSGSEDPLSDTLTNDVYTIVGYGAYSQYLTWHRGTSNIGKGSFDAFLVVPKESFRMDAYTSIYVSVDHADQYLCYDSAYEDVVDAVKDGIESIGDARCRIRYDSIQSEATKDLNDAKAQIKDAEDELADAEKKLAEAENELTDGESELVRAEEDLKDGEEEIRDGEKQLAKAKSEIASKENELKDAKKQLALAKKKLRKNEKRLENGFAKYEKGLADYQKGRRQYEQGLASLEDERTFYRQSLPQKESLSTLEGYSASLFAYERLKVKQEQGEALNREEQGTLLLLNRVLPEIQKATPKEDVAPNESVLREVVSSIFVSWESTLLESEKTLQTTKETLDQANRELASTKKQLSAARKEWQKGKKKLDENEAKLKDGEKQLRKAKATIADKESELNQGKKEIEDANKKLEDARKELETGRKKISDAKKEYDEAKKEADVTLTDAKAKVADGEEELSTLEVPEWYVLDRNSIQNYVEYGMDAKKIGAIGEVFPTIFFLVAALVSLTTMTRMVEENRTQIGTLKALGYGKASITLKYILYALTASLLGGVPGLLVGNLYFPFIIMRAYGMLYENLTDYHTPFQSRLSLFSVAIAVFCTVFATILACYRELSSTPASLMRPSPPKQGKRVFFERITFIWKRLNFTKKATVRNLVRYKKRFFMTVFGIGGCMALLMVGFGLRDSIREIANHQYGNLWTYDATLDLDTDNIEDFDELSRSIRQTEGVADGLFVSQSSMEFQGNGAVKEGTLLVPKDLSSWNQFIILRSRTGKEVHELTDDGAVVTEKLASMLDLNVGDALIVKESDVKRYEVTVTAITENYINHFVYMSPELYRRVINEEPEYNQMLLHLEQETRKDSDRLSVDLLKNDSVVSINMITELREHVGDMMRSLDRIIWVIIVSAGLLAFVVLFNLNNINITERKRELATIKVLGFYDMELAEYVYRENLILMLFGILAGIAIGVPLHQFIIRTCEIDMMMFCREIKFPSYVYSALLTVLFSLLINAGMYFKFKKIDMVESLKSVE